MDRFLFVDAFDTPVQTVGGARGYVPRGHPSAG
jgi:hypothetical protein